MTIDNPYHSNKVNVKDSWIKGFTKDVDCPNIVFKELKEDNVFRLAYLVIQRIRGLLK